MPVAQRRSAQGRWRAPRCWRAAWFGSAIGSKTADAQRRTLVATGAGRAFPRRTPNREFVRCAANWSSQVLSRGRTARKGRPSSVLSRGNSGGGHAIKRTQFVAIGIAKISEIHLAGRPWRTPGGSSIVVPPFPTPALNAPTSSVQGPLDSIGRIADLPRQSRNFAWGNLTNGAEQLPAVLRSANKR